ncbi:type I polyketide synthase, partial [Streptomyces sp. DSM 41886]
MTTEEKLLDYLKLVTADLHKTRQRLKEVEERTPEPIAIVAMSCRYPGGVRSPEDLWRLVAEGGDAITEFPADRGWDLDALYHEERGRPGTSYVRHGGFLHDAAEFDPGFFGISPREALAMDPQQRLLLETSWEAIERAGINPQSLAGTRTGVFAGVMYHDYASRMPTAPEGLEGYFYNGSAGSVASGRIAYALGLEGPAVTVDTACSSSLVALHLACHALRESDCTMALAAGATVLASPNLYVESSRQQALAADGRCKAFADAADGAGFSEGVGVLLLERLSDARRNGHPVLAVVRGSAVNQDGASSGLTAPNGPAQERVIRAALANAGLTTADIDGVEAHGTGTTLGDPIEAQALIATYGQERSAERPLWLGSLKSNIGHSQAAAGVGGVIKTVMAMRHGVLPRTLHVDRPSSHVEWDAGAVRLLTEAVPWPETGRPRRAGVSSFGASGTNAHAIIEQPEEPAPRPAADGADGADGERPTVLVLHGAEPAAVGAQAAALLDHLEDEPALPLGGVAHALVTTRATLDHRAAVVARDRATALDGLAALADGRPDPSAVTGRALPGADRPVLVFPGQGSQWVGMAVDLLDVVPEFAVRMGECEEALAPFVEWSLGEVLRDVSGGWLERVDVVQPVLWAVMVSLAEVWRVHGVVPSAVVGHSQGEIAAAVVAGGLSLEDGARVVALRSRALLGLSGRGGMVSVGESVGDVVVRVAGWGERISVAAVNGPRATVVSGDPEALAELLAVCEAEGVRARRVPVDYASHGPQVESIRDELLTALAEITPRQATVPFFSTVTAEPVDTGGLDAAYWYTNLRETVRFEDTTRALLAAGHGLFVEVSAHPVLTAAIEDSIQAAAEDTDTEAAAVGTLRKDENGPLRFLTSLAEAHAHGARVDWTAHAAPAAAGATGPAVPLPTYAFQRRRYWLDAPAGTASAAGLGLSNAEHPLLGALVALADADGVLFTGQISLRAQPWLAGHAVRGDVLLPGTALLELAVQAGDQVGCGTVEELTLEAPLVLPERGDVQLQLVVDEPGADGRRALRLYARPDATAPWTRHAEGIVAPGAEAPASGLAAAWPPADAEPLPVDGLYEQLAARGFAYDGAFRGLRAAWHRAARPDGEPAELYAEVALPETARADAEHYGLHPALLDAALHPLALVDGSEADGGRLPFSWSGVTLHAVGAAALRVRLRLLGTGQVAVTVADAAGELVADIDGLALRPPAGAPADAAGPALRPVVWLPLTAPVDAAGPVEGADVLRLVGGDGLGSVYEVVGRVLGWVRGVLAGGGSGVVVTCGAVGVGGGDVVCDPGGAGVWGLVRSVQVEHPGRLVLLDVGAGGDSGVGDGVVAAAVASGEPQLALRDGQFFVPRLGDPAPPVPRPAPLPADGAVVITGGTGMLGMAVARHVVGVHGVRQVVLVSRSGEGAVGVGELVAELAGVGAEVRVVAGDVADRGVVEEVFAGLDRPLSAVVHATGVLADGIVDNLTEDTLARVLRSKVDGAWHVHEVLGGLGWRVPLVLCSSAAGVLGSGGQGAYAAANAVLDGLAQVRGGAGLPGVSLAWGLWEQRSAMTGGLGEADLARMARGGLQPLTTAEGLALLDQALDGLEPEQGRATLLAARLAPGAAAQDLPALLRHRAPAHATRRRRRRAADAPAADPLRQRLAALAEPEQRHAVLTLVRENVAAVLGHASPDTVAAGRPFKDLGFDSLTAVELRNRLNTATGLRLPATLVFDHPTPEALAGLIRTRVLDLAPAQPQTLAGGGGADEPVAIVGMACRYPGGVESPEDLWRLVVDGGDAVGDFPGDRGWDLAGIYDPDPERVGTSYTRRGGFLPGAGDFDAELFGISPREALAMDPQQRLLLETSWEVFERAGLDPLGMRGKDVGVFAGVMYHDYGSRLHSVPEDVEGYLATGASSSVISGRIAYSFGLEGPALTVDTACSSSLVALHLAAQSLRNGECSM